MRRLPPKTNRCQLNNRRCPVVEWAWVVGPAAAVVVVAEAWGEGWAEEWDEAKDKVADGAAAAWARDAGAVWVLSAYPIAVGQVF